MQFSISGDMADKLKTITAADAQSVSAFDLPADFKKDGYMVFPGFVDVHVHLREPGFFYKETIQSGSLAAAHGGYTDVCSMPNLSPVPDSLPHLQPQLNSIEKNACIRVHPYGSITVGQKGERLSDMEAMAPFVAGFSDDGRGIQSESVMRAAMQKAKRLDKIIAAHCEDNSLLHGGYIHDGAYARLHGHAGICSESEWRPIARDLKLAEETGCKYHVCHVSTRESVQLIREAKRRGVDVTCETAPHYLVLNDMDLQEDGRFKMNPPLRAEADRQALLEALRDGTIDMIATDHAPHSAEEKAKGLRGSLMGVVGLETAFPILYTKLVKTGQLPLDRLIEAMAVNPRVRFSLPWNGDACVWDMSAQYTVRPERFFSMGASTPFAGETVFGKCVALICGGKTVWQENLIEK